ncbi:phosphopyruvate hydratase [Candidatus Kaiserbacteria bacterium]|nr:phosphopyruvate hydratase [Candidatus Kaiserbacteria bacterium]
MNPITEIFAEEIKDSRDKPTLRISVRSGEHIGIFEVPSGASTGSREAHVLKDADGHMGSAIHTINERLAPILLGMDVSDQRALDTKMIELDGTPQKSVCGGNTMIGISVAAAKAAAAAHSMELYAYLRRLADITPSRRAPLLYMNYINGGMHAHSPLAFQEHMIVPQTESVTEALDMAAAIGQKLAEILASIYGSATAQTMGDEGGYVLPVGEIERPFEALMHAIDTAGYAGKVLLAIDAAATSFYADGMYQVGGQALTHAELSRLYSSLAAKYPILSIEDPFEENAIDDFATLQADLTARIVGDDLTVTNAHAITQAAERRAIRAVIIKPNQVGTLSETLDAMKTARDHDIDCIVSHRSGETHDTFISDLAYAFGTFGLKAGSLRKEERVAKYSRLKSISLGPVHT